MPRPPSSDPFPQLVKPWLFPVKVVNGVKRFCQRRSFVFFLFYLLVFLALQDHSPVEWIVFKGVVDHHHDDDDEPEKAFLLLSAPLTHPQIRLQRVTCASPTLSQA